MAGRLSMIGLGVTEAGLASSDTPVMKDLYSFLKTTRQNLANGTWESPNTPHHRICILDMDNVPQNGDKIKAHMMALANDDDDDDDEMKEFLETRVAFLNTMVDRITGQREGSDGHVPRTEPTPSKALVICDPDGDIPTSLATGVDSNAVFGVVIRKTRPEMDRDIALKLQVANGTHTAVAHVLALVKWTNTDKLAPSDRASEEDRLTASVLMTYLDALVTDQVQPSFGDDAAVRAAYEDWRPRLTHPHFGLSSFFITQNGAAKGGIRLGPTIVKLLLNNSNPQQQQQPLTVTMAYAFAVLLRWLTPRDEVVPADNGIYTGWLAGADRQTSIDKKEGPETVAYADGLRHNLKEGWYEFKCACNIGTQTVSQMLANLGSAPCQPSTYCGVIRAYLLSPDGGDLGAVADKPELDTFIKAVATLYARMVAGDSLVEMLEEMTEASGPYAPKGMATSCGALVDEINQSNGRPLFYRPSPIPLSSQLLKAPIDAENAASVIVSEVAAASVIDLHTHLLPPSHGSLCLWGIDELLTYVSLME